MVLLTSEKLYNALLETGTVENSLFLYAVSWKDKHIALVFVFQEFPRGKD
jgi:hypothetical protein